MEQAPSTVADLRKEAEAVKKCFTDFGFQAILFASAAFGLILANTDKVLVLFAAYLVPPIMIAVGRIGTHKYATANRIYGFQLCLERRRQAGNATESSGCDKPPAFGWEEAMGAWRIVQASVFEALYRTSLLTGNRPTRRNRKAQDNEAWWDLDRLLEADGLKGVTYHAGSYLTTMLAVLYGCVAVAVAVAIWACVRVWMVLGAGIDWRAILVTGLCVCLVAYCARSAYFANQRRRLLESKILSISVCAVVWDLVLAAHERARPMADPCFTAYTTALAAEVDALLKPGLGLIRFRGHFPKGEYDVHDGNRHVQGSAAAPTIHRRV